MKRKKDQMALHLMMLPGMILLAIFSFTPMFGIIMAFQNYMPARGIAKSPWVGMDNFIFMFQMPDSKQIFINTITIAVGKIILSTFVTIVFALLLNEIKNKFMKRSIQTIVYLPNFLSWVILATVVVNIFSYEGPINAVLEMLGIEPILFMASNKWAPVIVVVTDCWKNFGYGSIIYLAALSGVNVNLYESAAMDGANRLKQIWHVTLPAIIPTIVLVATLSLGNVLNAGFDQIYNMYNPLVYESIDIIDTFVYRIGLVDMQYGLSTAVGLFKSVVSMVLIILSYWLARKWTGYRIF